MNEPGSDPRERILRTRLMQTIAFGAAMVAVLVLVAAAVVVVLASRLSHVRKELDAARQQIARLEADRLAAKSRPATTQGHADRAGPASRPATRRVATRPTAVNPGHAAALEPLLRAAVAATPSAGQIRQIRTALHDAEQALARGDAGPETSTLTKQARCLLARWAMDRGDWANAEADLQPLPATDVEARKLRARLALHKGQRAAAVGELEATVAAVPADAEARFWFGLALVQTGRLDDADSHFAWLAANAPHDPVGPYWQGMVRLRRLEPEKAMPFFDQAIALSPAFAPAWEGGALALANLGNVEGALRRLDEAVRLAPGRAETAFARAVCLARLNRRDEAMASLEQAAAIDRKTLDDVGQAPALDRLLDPEDRQRLTGVR